MQFHIPTLKLFKEMGWETAVAARNDYQNPEECQIPYCDHFYDITFRRFPFMPQNIGCYQKLKDIIDQGDFQIVHCHTPVGGALTRLAARKARKNGTRVLYTAHGFHFYRGAPLLNWLMYYPIEKYCSHLTDGIVTINQEDYAFAQKRFRKPRIFYLPGIGVDVDSFSKSPDNATDLHSLFNLRADEKMMISVGEMTANKNHRTIIQALTLAQLKNVRYVIIGDGVCRSKLEEYAASLNVSHRVHFLGYRRDIPALLRAADVFVFPSYREGLPVALMEAMVAGVPVVASCVRGNMDLIQDGVNGFLCKPADGKGFADRVSTLLSDTALAKCFTERSKEIVKKFDIKNVLRVEQEIYKDILDQ